MKRHHAIIPGQVPCNGCIECCKGDAVRLLPGDDVESYQTIPHFAFPGERMLAHDAHNNCVYLGSTGCTIHDRKPLMCRRMDCRVIAQKVSFQEAQRLDRENKIRLKVWRVGRELLKARRQP